MAQALLELSTATEPDRPLVRIDGKDYRLAVPEDFGLREDAELRLMQKRLANIYDKGNLSDEEVAELVSLLNRLVRRIVPGIEDAVLAKLKDFQKLRLMEAFTRGAASRQPTPEPPAPAKEESPKT